MFNLISGELFKVRKNKVTRIVSVFMLLINVMFICLMIYSKVKYNETDENGINSLVYSFDGDIILLIIALFVGNIVTADYTSGSIRQMASSGYSRRKLVAAQYIALSTAITIIYSIFAAINFTAGSIVNGVGKADLGRVLLSILGLVVMFWAVSAIAFFIALLVKNGGLSLGINSMIIIGGGIISTMLAYLTDNELFVKYWLTNMRSSVVDMTLPVGEQCKFIVAFFVILIIFFAGASAKFRHSDID